MGEMEEFAVAAILAIVAENLANVAVILVFICLIFSRHLFKVFSFCSKNLILPSSLSQSKSLNSPISDQC